MNAAILSEEGHEQRRPIACCSAVAHVIYPLPLPMRATTHADYQQRIGRALRFLEQNLDREVPIDELAHEAHFSPFHFHRIFRGMVGETVQACARRLRLEQAAARLSLTRLPVIQIALECGYTTHESFTRAFKAHFGVAPSAYRHRSAPPPKPAPSPTTHSLPLVVIAELPIMHLVCLRHVGPYDTVPDAFEKLFAWAAQARIPSTHVIGIAYDDIEVTDPAKVRFDVCVSVDAPGQPDGPFFFRQVGGKAHAVLRHVGPFHTLHQAYLAMFGSWFPHSGHEPQSAGCVEWYRSDPKTTPASELVTDLCVPIAD